VKRGFILLWTRSPSEFCIHLSQLSGPLVTGTDIPLRVDALQRHLRSSPLVGASYPRSPRCRSQVFSTSQRFQLSRIPRPYFMPQPFLDCPPTEPSPRKDRGPLPRPPAPLQFSTWLRNALPATLLPAVSPTPTFKRSRLDPSTNYGFPFHESEGPLPGRPGSPTEGSFLPPALPTSKLSSLHESVRTGSSKPELSGRYSLGVPAL